jgi:arginine decarboxylase
MTAFTPDDARRTYSLPYWSEGYFDVGDGGALVVRPDRTPGREVALDQVVEQARGQGLKLPLLVRFADILGDKLGRMQAAFAKAMAEQDYAGGYTAVYPIKVNQHLSVAGELVARAGAGFGLEAGSKPELIAVLALSRGGIVICNGYKDREYIRLALIGRKLGLDVFIVIEKPSELDTVLEEAAALGVEPLLGARLRLAAPADRPGRPPGCGRQAGRAQAAAFPHGLADLQPARHRRRHARSHPLHDRAQGPGRRHRLHGRWWRFGHRL